MLLLLHLMIYYECTCSCVHTVHIQAQACAYASACMQTCQWIIKSHAIELVEFMYAALCNHCHVMCMYASLLHCMFVMMFYILNYKTIDTILHYITLSLFHTPFTPKVTSGASTKLCTTVSICQCKQMSFQMPFESTRISKFLEGKRKIIPGFRSGIREASLAELALQ